MQQKTYLSVCSLVNSMRCAMEKFGDHTASLSPPLSSTSCSSSKPSVEAFRKAGEVVKAGFNPVGVEIRKLERFSGWEMWRCFTH